MRKRVVLKNLFWCWEFSKREIPLVFVSLVLSCLASYIVTLEPVYTGSLVDYLANMDKNGFLKTLFFLFCFQGVNLILSILNDYLGFNIKERSTLRGESFFFKETIRREKTWFLQGREALVLNTLKEDVPVVLSIWTSLLPVLVTNTFSLILVSYRLIVISVPVFLVTIVLSSIPFFIQNAAGKKENIINKQGKQCGDKYVKAVQESINLSYESTGKASTYLQALFEKKISLFFSVYKEKLNLNMVYRSNLFVINILSLFAIYLLTGYGIYQGWNSVGDFLVVVMLTQQLRGLLNGYGGAYKQLLSQSAAIDRVRFVLKREEESYISYIPQASTSIEISNFSFSYGESMVLNGLSICLEGPGLFILKGSNGSGKTTLLKALVGMVEKRCIKTGGISISGCSDSSDIAYAPSVPFLCTATVRSNLLLGKHRDDAKLIKILSEVGLIDWLNSLEDGLDTVCDQMKIGLSKGEMLRFSLARNLIQDRNIYLVDEMEDGIDEENRKLVVSIIEKLSTEKLVIVASHTSIFDSIAKKTITL